MQQWEEEEVAWRAIIPTQRLDLGCRSNCEMVSLGAHILVCQEALKKSQQGSQGISESTSFMKGLLGFPGTELP